MAVVPHGSVPPLLPPGRPGADGLSVPSFQHPYQSLASLSGPVASSALSAGLTLNANGRHFARQMADFILRRTAGGELRRSARRRKAAGASTGSLTDAAASDAGGAGTASRTQVVSASIASVGAPASVLAADLRAASGGGFAAAPSAAAGASPAAFVHGAATAATPAQSALAASSSAPAVVLHDGRRQPPPQLRAGSSDSGSGTSSGDTSPAAQLTPSPTSPLGLSLDGAGHEPSDSVSSRVGVDLKSLALGASTSAAASLTSGRSPMLPLSSTPGGGSPAVAATGAAPVPAESSAGVFSGGASSPARPPKPLQPSPQRSPPPPSLPHHYLGTLPRQLSTGSGGLTTGSSMSSMPRSVTHVSLQDAPRAVRVVSRRLSLEGRAASAGGGLESAGATPAPATSAELAAGGRLGSDGPSASDGPQPPVHAALARIRASEPRLRRAGSSDGVDAAAGGSPAGFPAAPPPLATGAAAVFSSRKPRDSPAASGETDEAAFFGTADSDNSTPSTASAAGSPAAAFAVHTTTWSGAAPAAAAAGVDALATGDAGDFAFDEDTDAADGIIASTPCMAQNEHYKRDDPAPPTSTGSGGAGAASSVGAAAAGDLPSTATHAGGDAPAATEVAIEAAEELLVFDAAPAVYTSTLPRTIDMAADLPFPSQALSALNPMETGICECLVITVVV